MQRPAQPEVHGAAHGGGVTRHDMQSRKCCSQWQGVQPLGGMGPVARGDDKEANICQHAVVRKTQASYSCLRLSG